MKSFEEHYHDLITKNAGKKKNLFHFVVNYLIKVTDFHSLSDQCNAFASHFKKKITDRETAPYRLFLLL